MKTKTKISAPFYSLQTVLEVGEKLFNKFNINCFNIEDLSSISCYQKTSSNFDRLISTLKMYGLLLKDNRSNTYRLSVDSVFYFTNDTSRSNYDTLVTIFRKPLMNIELAEFINESVLSREGLINHVVQKFGTSIRTAREIVVPFIDSMTHLSEVARLQNEKKSILAKPINEVLSQYSGFKSSYEKKMAPLEQLDPKTNYYKKSFEVLANEFESRIFKCSSEENAGVNEMLINHEADLYSYGLTIEKNVGNTSFRVSLSKKIPEISLEELKILSSEFLTFKDRIDYMIWEKEQ